MQSQEVARALGLGPNRTMASAGPATRRRALSFVPSLPVKLDGLRLSLLLLVVINVSRVHQAVDLIAKMRPGLTLVFLAGAFAVLQPRLANTNGLFKTTEAKLLLGLFALSCVSAVAGISLGNSARFILERYIKVVIAAFLLLAGIRHVRDLYTLVFAYVVGSGILAYMAIFVFKLSKNRGSETARLSDLYSFDANDIGVVLLVGLPLTLLIAQHSTGIRKWFCIAVVAAIGVACARSGSRGTLVGLVGTGAFLLVALKTIPVWKRAAFVSVVSIALVIAAPPGYWEQMKTIVGLKQDYNWTSKDGRKELILRGLTYMAHYPITGLGIYNFHRAECMSDLSEKVRNRVRGKGIRCQAPHNTYIQVGAETGGTGLVLWALLTFGGIVRMRKLRRRLPKGWRTGDAEQRFMYDATMYLPLAMIAFAITSFFVSFAWIDIVYIVVVYLAGLTLAIRQRLAKDQVPQGAAPVRVPIPQPVPAALRTT